MKLPNLNYSFQLDLAPTRSRTCFDVETEVLKFPEPSSPIIKAICQRQEKPIEFKTS